MGQSDEIGALLGQIPDTADRKVLLIELRDLADEGAQFSEGRLSTGGDNLTGDSVGGHVFLGGIIGETWLRVDTANGTYFVWNSRGPGPRRYLERFADTHLNLVGTLQQDDCCWTVTPNPGSSDFRLTVGAGPNNALARSPSAGFVCMNPYGAPWEWNAQPVVATTPAPDAITAEAYWWGFHLCIPESLMAAWTAIGITVGGVTTAIAGATGPAAPFVALAAAYITAEFTAMQNADAGNGVYVSMSWFAPAVFVPTPM